MIGCYFIRIFHLSICADGRAVVGHRGKHEQLNSRFNPNDMTWCDSVSHLERVMNLRHLSSPLFRRQGTSNRFPQFFICPDDATVLTAKQYLFGGGRARSSLLLYRTFLATSQFPVRIDRAVEISTLGFVCDDHNPSLMQYISSFSFRSQRRRQVTILDAIPSARLSLSCRCCVQRQMSTRFHQYTVLLWGPWAHL